MLCLVNLTIPKYLENTLLTLPSIKTIFLLYDIDKTAAAVYSPTPGNLIKSL